MLAFAPPPLPVIRPIAYTHPPTAEDEYGELLTCSFEEFCGSIRIKTPNGLKPFHLFDWQSQAADYLLNIDRKIIPVLSSRQTGKTSFLLALMLYLALSRRQFSGLMIHRTTQDAFLLCRRLKKFIPTGTPMTTDSLSLLEFANTKSAIHFRSSNPKFGADGAEQTGRGLESIDLAIVEEASHTSNLADVQGVVAPTLTWGTPGNIVYVGTASNKQSHYFQTLAASAGGEQALEKTLNEIRTGKAKPFQILEREAAPSGILTHWRAIPRFAEEDDFLGRVKREHGLTDEQISSEYDLQFTTTIDQAIFDYQDVQSCANGQYAGPVEGKLYYCGLDCSTTGNDYTVFSVLEWCPKSRSLALRHLYRERKKPSEYHLAKIGKIITQYQPQRVCVELNHVGSIYHERLEGAFPEIEIVGRTTTERSKQVLIARLNLALEELRISYPDEDEITGELLCFRRNGNKMEGKPHDDVVISLAEGVAASPFNSHNYDEPIPAEFEPDELD